MKARRQAEILSIIQEYDIETQDQLLEKLREKGLKSTQATISRDIKELHLVKELTLRFYQPYQILPVLLMITISPLYLLLPFH